MPLASFRADGALDTAPCRRRWNQDAQQSGESIHGNGGLPFELRRLGSNPRSPVSESSKPKPDMGFGWHLYEVNHVCLGGQT